MDKYNLKDALLFISRGDTHEILIETNQRTRPDVQSNLQELLNLYPDIIPGFAPIFPDTCYHLTHYWPAAADIPVASDNSVH
ncbi:hypothetical protein MTQ49_24470, partial [Escherichia coli]|nr:hypothetical protein [Escherichia coli]